MIKSQDWYSQQNYYDTNIIIGNNIPIDSFYSQIGDTKKWPIGFQERWRSDLQLYILYIINIAQCTMKLTVWLCYFLYLYWK